MYVYYETFQYKSGDKSGKTGNCYTHYIYTHRVTVFENCNKRTVQKLLNKYRGFNTSYQKWKLRHNGVCKFYVREHVRIVRLRITHPKHPYSRNIEKSHTANVRNFAMGIFAETVIDGVKVSRLGRFNFLESN